MVRVDWHRNPAILLVEAMAEHDLSVPAAGPSERRVGRRAFLAFVGAGAAALALAPSSAAARTSDRGGIYQRIWDLDQAANGVPAILAEEAGDRRQGFVKVDERAGQDPEHRLFAEVHIPARKRNSYELCKALFDNYRLDQTKRENNRPEEAREILALLEALTDSAPMVAAREHLEAQSGARYAREAWQELIFEIWFRQFDDGRNLDLSGFEHVAVGEQKGGKVNGHHFWYRCCGRNAHPAYPLCNKRLSASA